MRKLLLLLTSALALTSLQASAQVPLSAYVDANGFIDVQKLTCAQLAGTFQEDADALTAWYSGWYNGLAKKHYIDLRKGKLVEHEVIMFCNANPEKRARRGLRRATGCRCGSSPGAGLPDGCRQRGRCPPLRMTAKAAK